MQILILESVFKENRPDISNTHVIGVHKELNSYDVNVDHPQAGPARVDEEYDIQLSGFYAERHDTVISRKEFIAMDGRKIRKNTSIVYDVKSALLKKTG